MRTLWIAIPTSLLAALLLFAATLGTAVADEKGSTSTAPSNLTVTKSGDSVRIQWDVAPHKDYSKVNYVWQWDADDPDGRRGAVVKGARNEIFRSEDLLTPGKTYKFQVESAKTDENGSTLKGDNGIISGGKSNIVSYTVPVTTDASGLTARQGGIKVILNWTPGNDPHIAEQHIKRREPKKGWTTIKVGGDVETYTDNDVAVGKRYIYRVESWDADGNKLGVSKRAVIKVK